ncbi:MAG: hypothetical protein GY938_17005, partial [Ketobacter sp.]|nr:hypothetical protein [Ketobacter sp.]
MKIINNDGTTITTDINDGDMTTVAVIGDTYRGLQIFETLDIRGLARVETDGDIKVLSPNTLNGLEIDGLLEANSVEVGDFPIVVNNGVMTVSEGVINTSDLNLDNSTFTVGSITTDTISLTNNSTFTGSSITAAAITLSTNSVLTHPATTTTGEYSLDVSVTDTLTIDTGSSIDVSERGYLGGNSGGNSSNYGRTVGNTTTGGSYAYSAGSYGGLGGKSSNFYVNAVYGSMVNPDELGSGGGAGGSSSYYGGDGGGLVRITAGDIVLDGSIRANGGDGINNLYNGGGSGGGVHVEVGTLSGTGMITANGGKQTAAHGSTTGGGGGRIAVYYDDISGFDTANITAHGGIGSSANGGAGTVYTKSSALSYGDLIVDNNNIVTSVYSTPLIS